ncbi:hypothetical protein Psi02_15830 [Planotetraspora silvatica]|uniref:Uncharacterized protein n=1 Tax=Planotetraspora silvatica TaxID=234614 RepID=A0A8J3UGH2_9ACTN|nr:hypothetical protein Psi02_15830 [Planotetraspora silvatica]
MRRNSPIGGSSTIQETDGPWGTGAPGDGSVEELFGELRPVGTAGGSNEAKHGADELVITARRRRDA